MKQPKIIQEILHEKSIILMESDTNYTVIHLTDGNKLISGYNLKFYEERIDNKFFMRLNRSVLVNRMFVELINIEAAELTLNNGRKVNIARRRIKAFQDWF